MSSYAPNTEFCLPELLTGSYRSFDKLFSAANNAFIQPFLQAVPEGMIVLDKDGRIVYLNNCGAMLLDLDPQSVVGMFVSDAVDFTPTILSALESGEGYIERDFAIQSPSRGLLRFTKSAVVVRDDEGQMPGVVDYFRRTSIPEFRPRSTCNTMTARYRFQDIIGSSLGLRHAVEVARKIANVDSSVLLQGESGTGKEMFAHAIHENGARRNGPLITINCASIPESLMESELFGYAGGTFTGANRTGRSGVFEQANGGTLFLDEIAELPFNLQAKLLRVLQDGLVKRLGAQKPIQTDVRIIAATNSELRNAVDKNRFRLDLYYRLAVVTIQIPPLRERVEDIEILLKHFGSMIAEDLGKRKPVFDRSAISLLSTYRWPGNVRELKNEIERALILAENSVLTKADFQSIAARLDRFSTDKQRDFSHKGISCEDCFMLYGNNNSLIEIERAAIVNTLSRVAGNVSRAARILGISRNTLYRKLEQFNISG